MAFQKPTIDELSDRFSYHPPHGDQAGRYDLIRQQIRSLAVFCVELTPCCPEQTRALNALDEVLFLFNAAIARHEKE